MTKILNKRGSLITHASKRYKQADRPFRITIHHSATDSGSAKSFAEYHVKTHGWPGIGYHFVILKTGDIEQCWNEEVISYHTSRQNAGNIGICLVGNGTFTQKQLSSLIQLIKQLQKKWNIPVSQVKGHREWPHQNTLCPALNMHKIRAQLPDRPLLRRGSANLHVIDLQQRLLSRGIPLPQFGADGIYGQETEMAVRELQREYGLAVDGITGPITWKALLA